MTSSMRSFRTWSCSFSGSASSPRCPGGSKGRYGSTRRSSRPFAGRTPHWPRSSHEKMPFTGKIFFSGNWLRPGLRPPRINLPQAGHEATCGLSHTSKYLTKRLCSRAREKGTADESPATEGPSALDYAPSHPRREGGIKGSAKRTHGAGIRPGCRKNKGAGDLPAHGGGNAGPFRQGMVGGPDDGARDAGPVAQGSAVPFRGRPPRIER